MRPILTVDQRRYLLTRLSDVKAGSRYVDLDDEKLPARLRDVRRRIARLQAQLETYRKRIQTQRERANDKVTARKVGIRGDIYRTDAQYAPLLDRIVALEKEVGR